VYIFSEHDSKTIIMNNYTILELDLSLSEYRKMEEALKNNMTIKIVTQTPQLCGKKRKLPGDMEPLPYPFPIKKARHS
jgi:hypothetical protein